MCEDQKLVKSNSTAASLTMLDDWCDYYIISRVCKPGMNKINPTKSAALSVFLIFAESKLQLMLK